MTDSIATELLDQMGQSRANGDASLASHGYEMAVVDYQGVATASTQLAQRFASGALGGLTPQMQTWLSQAAQLSAQLAALPSTGATAAQASQAHDLAQQIQVLDGQAIAAAGTTTTSFNMGLVAGLTAVAVFLWLVRKKKR